MSQHDGEGAAHDECVVQQTDDGETEWNPFEEFHDEVELEVVPKVMAKDGMPTNFAPYNDDRSDIPPLNPETSVCMGVYTEFVIRDDWRDVIATFKPSEVERTKNGTWRVKRKLAVERLGDRARGWWLRQMSRNLVSVVDEWVSVEPIRPPCRHYVNQLAPYYLNPKHKKMFRLCSARRTTEGAFMDISDMGMFACEMREPRDIESEQRIREFDKKVMDRGKNRTYHPMFKGFDEKPPDDQGGGPGGIFGG